MTTTTIPPPPPDPNEPIFVYALSGYWFMAHPTPSLAVPAYRVTHGPFDFISEAQHFILSVPGNPLSPLEGDEIMVLDDSGVPAMARPVASPGGVSMRCYKVVNGSLRGY